jgi:hypothetical protein
MKRIAGVLRTRMRGSKRHRILGTFVVAMAVAGAAAPTAGADPWLTDNPSGIVRPDDRALAERHGADITIVVPPEGSFDRATPPDGRPVNATPATVTPEGSFDQATPPDGRPVNATPATVTPEGSFDRATPPDGRPVNATPATVTPEGSFDQATPPDDRPVNATPVSATPIISSRPAVRPDDRTDIRGPGVAPVPETIIVGDDGFDWGDAGIGAGMALGLVLLACGMLLLLRHRRTPEVAAS